MSVSDPTPTGSTPESSDRTVALALAVQGIGDQIAAVQDLAERAMHHLDVVDRMLYDRVVYEWWHENRLPSEPVVKALYGTMGWESVLSAMTRNGLATASGDGLYEWTDPRVGERIDALYERLGSL